MLSSMEHGDWGTPKEKIDWGGNASFAMVASHSLVGFSVWRVSCRFDNKLQCAPILRKYYTLSFFSIVVGNKNEAVLNTVPLVRGKAILEGHHSICRKVPMWVQMFLTKSFSRAIASTQAMHFCMASLVPPQLVNFQIFFWRGVVTACGGTVTMSGMYCWHARP